LKTGHFYSDCFEGFAHVFPYNPLTQSKQYTPAIEWHNCITRLGTYDAENDCVFKVRPDAAAHFGSSCL
jgi:hypothetical protein